MKSIEELLQPRYKVIGLWPNSGKTELGDIIKIEINTTTGFHFREATFFGPVIQMKKLDQYPHLFKKLKWWEEREIADLPEYVYSKTSKPKRFIKTELWEYSKELGFTYTINGEIQFVNMWDLHPATEQEYTTTLKQ
ncbi:MAG: hypothetical protein H7X88_01850 [Gloeobacteraceae cyanobacterium ES-bin-316]|nr:hypothetical protein [Ferruginibacter sp.]